VAEPGIGGEIPDTATYDTAVLETIEGFRKMLMLDFYLPLLTGGCPTTTSTWFSLWTILKHCIPLPYVEL
jgi:hypothetical protein